MVNLHRKERGQAMVELVIVAGFVLVPLFLAIPLLGKYLDVRSAAVQASRYAAWERTVWYGGDAATSMGWGPFSNKWKANEKSDTQIRNELGARQLSETGVGDSFSNADRSSGTFKGGSKALWQDRNSQKLLANYSDIQNNIGSNTAPGTLNLILSPIADLASTLGPFVLEMKGEYSATVNIKARDIDYDHFLFKNSTANFSEHNVLLANGWSANGPTDKTKTSVKQQVKGLTPSSIFAVEFGGVNIMQVLQGVLSVAVPEISKLDLGKIEPDVVPADRLK